LVDNAPKKVKSIWELLNRPIDESFVAWLASVGAVWLLVYSSHYESLWDMPPADVVLTATLVALIWTAFHTYQGVKESREGAKRSRETRANEAMFLANAVHIELQYLINVFPTLRENLELYSPEATARPRIEMALNRADLLPPDFGALLALVDGRVRWLDFSARVLRELEAGKSSSHLEKATEVRKSMRETIETMAEQTLPEVERRLRPMTNVQLWEDGPGR